MLEGLFKDAVDKKKAKAAEKKQKSKAVGEKSTSKWVKSVKFVLNGINHFFFLIAGRT